MICRSAAIIPVLSLCWDLLLVCLAGKFNLVERDGLLIKLNIWMTLLAVLLISFLQEMNGWSPVVVQMLLVAGCWMAVLLCLVMMARALIHLQCGLTCKEAIDGTMKFCCCWFFCPGFQACWCAVLSVFPWAIWKVIDFADDILLLENQNETLHHNTTLGEGWVAINSWLGCQKEPARKWTCWHVSVIAHVSSSFGCCDHRVGGLLRKQKVSLVPQRRFWFASWLEMRMVSASTAFNCILPIQRWKFCHGSSHARLVHWLFSTLGCREPAGWACRRCRYQFRWRGRQPDLRRKMAQACLFCDQLVNFRVYNVFLLSVYYAVKLGIYSLWRYLRE